MKELASSVAAIIPFLLTTSSGVRVNKTRLLEAIITAAIIGGMIYGTIKTDLDNIKETMREMKEDIRTIRHDLYLPSGQRDAWGYRDRTSATVSK